MALVIGWDIGGAHLKAALAQDGRIVAALQVAAPLRLGLGALVQAFAEAKGRLQIGDRHAVTMTGELADTFASRAEGVSLLIATAVRELAGAPLVIYAGRAGFVGPEEAGHHVDDIASANWHASAAIVARLARSALFADMGSTTTDLVPVVDGRLAARGYTDATRLAAGELVYTGLVRSAVMTIASRAPVAGHWTALINENFAHMADVHRILGTLPEAADLMPTADSRPKTPEASAARLARMVGRDVLERTGSDPVALARWFAEAQLRSITDAAMLVLSASLMPAHAPIIGAGIGTGLMAEIARRLCRPYVGFETLLAVSSQARTAAATCAPAAALAVLASDPDRFAPPTFKLNTNR
jgi:(4-(4-[2-(gamma-L-glutamylamino)ethyl]phenoxymethyl)furan-2-yl)methanamine synthase